MDFPSYEKNATRPHQGLTVNPPAFDADAGHAKTSQTLAVEQQWRDVKALGLDKSHPLSLNRDAAQVTNDPYKG